MSEEELMARAEELERKEEELTKKESELNERENELLKREADASKIAETIKEEFQKTLEEQKQDFETRLHQREEVIRQLASGHTTEQESSPFTELNRARIAHRLS